MTHEVNSKSTLAGIRLKVRGLEKALLPLQRSPHPMCRNNPEKGARSLLGMATAAAAADKRVLRAYAEYSLDTMCPQRLNIANRKLVAAMQEAASKDLPPLTDLDDSIASTAHFVATRPVLEKLSDASQKFFSEHKSVVADATTNEARRPAIVGTLKELHRAAIGTSDHEMVAALDKEIKSLCAVGREHKTGATGMKRMLVHVEAQAKNLAAQAGVYRQIGEQLEAGLTLSQAFAGLSAEQLEALA